MEHWRDSVSLQVPMQVESKMKDVDPSGSRPSCDMPIFCLSCPFPLSIVQLRDEGHYT